MKKDINYTEVIKETIEALKKGNVLVCSIDKKGKPNLMAIGWGCIGIVWGQPIFSIFIRPSRYTYNLIEQTDDFSVNIFDDKYKKVINWCGSVSGRDYDKFKETKLTPLKSKYIMSPIVKEGKINFECIVVAKVDINPEMLDNEIKERNYKSGDYHRVYLGKILICYKNFP
ncbi:MAG: flavin reductase family protein [Candidatus Omnitrophica bacterium]|nr:flavin reductase family protein [Candidatus Omnitrophota bacterium]MCM8808934.1 flavin reductase family protein [Candidatus Omnitrophota bacterium]MCM8810119.1 flavin reductase family protein [Candidatus Omnitrophota bacterium]